MVLVVGGNVLHHVKREGEVSKGGNVRISQKQRLDACCTKCDMLAVRCWCTNYMYHICVYCWRSTLHVQSLISL